MDDIPVLGALSSLEDEMGPDLFGANSQFTSENVVLKAPEAIKLEEDEFHVFKDPYLSDSEAKEPPLRALHAPLGADSKGAVKVELQGAEPDDQKGLVEHPGLPELSPVEDTLLPRAPPAAYNVHFLSSLLAQHRSSSIVPLGAWPREGAPHSGLRVIPVELKEAGSPVPGNKPEEAASANPHAQEACCKLPSSQEPRDPSDCSRKDANPMVICQLKGGTQTLCIDHAGTRELKALQLVPPYQDPTKHLQSDGPKPVTTVVRRFLPVPAKLNLIAQQLENGPFPPVTHGSTLPGPPQLTLAGYCDCFASGDFCNNCNCNNCCNNLRHEIERFRAIKACLDRNPDAFQPKIGRPGDVKPRHTKGCNCKRSGCLKNYCECYGAKIMCSSICKCIGCKNYEESPERKTLPSLASAAGTVGLEGGLPLAPSKASGANGPFTCISWEVVEATCACLLAQGEEAEKEHCSEGLAEQRVLEEFGRCLSQILRTEFKSKGLKIE